MSVIFFPRMMSVIIFILCLSINIKVSFWCWISTLRLHVAVCNIMWELLLVNKRIGRPAHVRFVPHPRCPG
jgi:hypothetical protein